MKKTKWYLLAIGAVAIAMAFLLPKCESGSSIINAGKDLLNLDRKKQCDTIYIEVPKLVYVYPDTMINKDFSLNDFDKKTQRRLKRIIKKVESDPLHQEYLYVGEYVVNNPGTYLKIDPAYTHLMKSTKDGWAFDTSLIARDSFFRLSEILKRYHPVATVMDSIHYLNWTVSISDSFTLNSPQRLYHTLPIDCYTKDQSAKLRRNSSKTMNLTTGMDARGYVQFGLMYRGSNGFGAGFFVSSGRYNGFNLLIPLARLK